MPSAESLALIRSEGERILELGRRNQERAVPQYPGWVMGDLLSHLGSILARTTLICRELATERPTLPVPPQGADMVDWCEASLREMLATLEESDPETPVWGFWQEPSIRRWVRRMVIETGLHRWDADQAFGEEGPLSEAVATAGLDEFQEMWVSRLDDMPAMVVQATDLARRWVYGSGTPEKVVDGTASAIYLRLMSRPSPVDLPEKWAEAVDNLAGPAKP
ncbi:MAG: maleylpyruvate isomerase family mycothiol-dependent enzyme [Acidimicrobiia bacterium]